MKNAYNAKRISLFSFASLGSFVILSSQAHAALPPGVTAAISEATTDGVSLGGLMLALAVAVGVIFWLKRKV